MNKPIIVIIAKGGAGKDSVAEELLKLGYIRIITYTTRPIGKNEIQDFTYHFKSTSEFLSLFNQDFFVDMNWFNKKDEGIVYYGISKESCENITNKSFIIVTPSGLKNLKKHNINCVSFMLNVSDEEIKRRHQLRGRESNEEMKRRFLADKKDFEGIESLVDYIVSNENRSPLDTANEIIDIINKLQF